MHVLVRDPADVDAPQVERDFVQRPFVCFCLRANGARPDDAVDVVRLRGVREAVPLGAERGDLLALEEVEGIDACRAVAVRAEGVDVAEERGVGGAVCELGGDAYVGSELTEMEWM